MRTGWFSSGSQESVLMMAFTEGGGAVDVSRVVEVECVFGDA